MNNDAQWCPIAQKFCHCSPRCEAWPNMEPVKVRTLQDSYRSVSTQPGDLDVFGRALKAGT